MAEFSISRTTTPKIVIDALADGSCRTIDDLDGTLPVKRWHLTDALRDLVIRDFAERVEEGCYRLTEKGLKAHRSGTAPKLTSPMKGRKRGPDGRLLPREEEKRRSTRITFRQRAWAAMRMSGSFTIGDLVMAAARGEREPERLLQQFLRFLQLSGYVIELPSNLRGTGPRARLVRRYRLLKDTGERVPVHIREVGILRDHNTGEDVPCTSQP